MSAGRVDPVAGNRPHCSETGSDGWIGSVVVAAAGGACIPRRIGDSSVVWIVDVVASCGGREKTSHMY